MRDPYWCSLLCGFVGLICMGEALDFRALISYASLYARKAFAFMTCVAMISWMMDVLHRHGFLGDTHRVTGGVSGAAREHGPLSYHLAVSLAV